MILIDGNSIAARAFFATHRDTKIFNRDVFVSTFLKSFLKVITDLVDFDTRIIFCIDARSWRKDFYPEYKENRKSAKDEVPYYQYIAAYEDLAVEMKSLLPIGIMRKVPYEADDLVAYYVRKFENSIIVSQDKDLKVLTDNKNVMYYNFVEDSMQKVDNPRLFLHRLICAGDGTDNIPSIVPRGEDNKPLFRFGPKTIDAEYSKDAELFINDRFVKTKIGKHWEQVKKNYRRNRILIDLDYSPIHDEDLTIDFKPVYSDKNVGQFFGGYMPDMYQRQASRIQAVMAHYAS